MRGLVSRQELQNGRMGAVMNKSGVAHLSYKYGVLVPLFVDFVCVGRMYYLLSK